MEDKKYYYISGTMGLTSSGSFSRDSNRWIIFDQNDVNRIGTNIPYSATKKGIFIPVDKFH